MSTAQSLLFLAVAAVVATAAKICRPLDPECCQPSLCPGWEWRTHGGLPPFPDAWGPPRWGMAASTVAYFVGNASGLNNDMERTFGSKLGYYGIGWELNNIPSNMTHLEKAEETEAKALKALNPEMRVGVTRNSVVLTTFWDSAKEKMEDPAYNHFWLQCDGKPCTNVWGLDEPCPRDPKNPASCDPTSFMMNFSNKEFADWYVYEYVGQAANNSLFDAVYFDAGVNVSVATDLDLQAYIVDSQRTFDRAYELLTAKGKWASSWVGFGTESTSGSPYNGIDAKSCAATLPRLIEEGANANHTLQMQTTAFGLCQRHRGGRCRRQGGGAFDQSTTWPHSPQDQDSTVAAFMIARGPSALLEMVVFGAYFFASDLTFPSTLSTDYGPPLGLATQTGSVFERKFERGTVRLDCST